MKKFIVIAGVSLLLFFVIYFAWSVISTIRSFQKIEEITHKTTPYQISDKKIVLLNISTSKLDTLFFSEVTLINFWASWCIPCIDEMPDFIDFKKKHNNRQILIASFDHEEVQKKIISEKKWDYTFYRIIDSTIFKMPEIFPKTIIVKKDSVIAEFYGKFNFKSNLLNTIWESKHL